MFETTGELSQLAERLTVILGLLIIIALLVSDKYIWTKARGLEWKTRCEKAEDRAEKAEDALRSITEDLQRAADKIEDGNRLQAEILQALLQQDRRQ